MKLSRKELLGHAFDIVCELKPVGPLAGSTPIDVVIALSSSNVEERTTVLRDLYDPASPRFRQFLSPREYSQKFDPPEASYQSLLRFVDAHKLKVVSKAAPKFIHITAPATTINKKFDVTLQEYAHPREERHFYAPATDVEVDLGTERLQITGLDNFWIPRRTPNPYQPRRKGSGPPRPADGSGNNGRFTSDDLRAAYTPGVTLTGKGQVVGILEIHGYLESDIRTYEQANSIAPVPLRNVYIDGYTGNDILNESAADIELVLSMAPGLAWRKSTSTEFNTPMRESTTYYMRWQIRPKASRSPR
jgi:Pro-kumamolisin, activation domain